MQPIDPPGQGTGVPSGLATFQPTPALLDAFVLLVSAYSEMRFAAVYPVMRHIVAVNDGHRVSTHRDESINEQLSKLLQADRRIQWLIVDARARQAWIADVHAAHELLLARNTARAVPPTTPSPDAPTSDRKNSSAGA